MTFDLKIFSRIPPTTILIYFASGIELWIFEAYGIPPLYLQVTLLSALIGWMMFTVLTRKGAIGSTPPSSTAVYTILLVYMRAEWSNGGLLQKTSDGSWPTPISLPCRRSIAKVSPRR